MVETYVAFFVYMYMFIWTNYQLIEKGFHPIPF